MKPSKAFLASAFITAVILIIIGAVTSVAFANKGTDTAALHDYQAREVEYQQREEQYKQLIQQANQQLEKANAELQALQAAQGGLAQSGQPASNAAAAQAGAIAAISPEKAGQIAVGAVDPAETPLKTPELVSYEGKAAYEVAFNKGTVYVDAQSGQILFNGTIPQQITADQAAKVASDYLNIKGILQTDQITFRGAQIYRVIFQNGTMAYLDMTGQITYVHPYEPPGTTQLASTGDGGGGSGGFYEAEGRDD